MDIRAVLIVLSTSALATVHGIPPVRIVGGEEVAPHSLPYQAGLFIPVQNNGFVFCGGSIIAPQTVLTSANCFKNAKGPVEVVLGAHEINSTESGQVRVNTSNVIIHPDFKGTPLNDIALVRLPEPINFNEYIQSIALSKDNSISYEGTQALVSGWGWISDYVRHLSPELRARKVSIVSNFGCELTYIGEVDENNICVTGRATCVGDSGGPLVIDNVQVGVVSLRNIALCEEGWPSAYVRVAGYFDWINSNIM